MAILMTCYLSFLISSAHPSTYTGFQLRIPSLGFQDQFQPKKKADRSSELNLFTDQMRRKIGICIEFVWLKTLATKTTFNETVWLAYSLRHCRIDTEQQCYSFATKLFVIEDLSRSANSNQITHSTAIQSKTSSLLGLLESQYTESSF